MEEEATTLPSLTDVLGIVSRRLWYIAIPFFLISFVAIIIAIKLPAIYRSAATILIEDQQVPYNMVQTTITDFADKRIELIKQKVLTTKNVSLLLNKYQLYLQDYKKLTMSELANKFEENVEIKMIGADVMDPRQGRGTKANIAFTIAFSDKKPDMAQMIANELVTLFLEENVRARTQRAKKTTEFLSEEAGKLKQEIQFLESSLADYKQKYGNSLPDLLQFNLTMVDSSTQEIRQIDSQIDTLKNRIDFLSDELARAQNGELVAQPSKDNNTLLNKTDQLQLLQAEYTRLSSLYKSSHPDVVKVKRQLQALDPYFEDELSPHQIEQELEQARQELRTLIEKYAPNHPDVLKQNHKVESLERRKEEANKNSRDVAPSKAAHSNNPYYISLQAQLISSKKELEIAYKQREQQKQKLMEFQSYVSQTPQVERGYFDILRDRENALKKYTDLKAKVLDAQLAQTLEEEQKGETFSLIEPPNLPARPEKPNRYKIAAMGIAFSLFSGVGLAFLVELMDNRVRNLKKLAAIMGEPPIVVIPYIENELDEYHRQRQKKFIWGIMGLFIIFAVISTHFFVIPLDQLYQKILWRLQYF
jgi:uncharacterized protein involved in exopolysaccharide biosynthesis